MIHTVGLCSTIQSSLQTKFVTHDDERHITHSPALATPTHDAASPGAPPSPMCGGD
jgi:hypothetical protein